MASVALVALATPALAGDKPAVSWQPASSRNFRPGRSRAIDMVVIHTVEGSQESCVNTFRSSERKVSAHYIVGRDGSIVQAVRDQDTAWHAGTVNGHSVGIEHEGFSARRDTWTPEGLRASARLTRWLCDTYGIPIDRQHIVGHVEVPGSHHGDPGRYFDWPLYMKLVRGEDAVITRSGPPRGDDDPDVADVEGPSTTDGRHSGDSSSSTTGNGGATGGNHGLVGRINEGATGGRHLPRTHDNGYGKAHPLLEEGMQSEEVRRLQKILNAAGANIAEDGIFGRETERAVKRFQKKHGCDVDGIVGPETWRKLDKVKLPEPPAPTPVPAPAPRDDEGLPPPGR